MNTATMERPRLDYEAANLDTVARPSQPLSVVSPLPMPRVYPAKMAKAILAVTKGIGAISKAGWNDFHKYNYLRWDDVMDRLSVLLPEHGLMVVPTEVGRTLVENDQAKNDQLVAISYEFCIISEEGEEWPMRPRLTAFGRVRDSKNICDDKAAAKCLTQAEKYFLRTFFRIRSTDNFVDSDADGTQVQEAGASKPPRPGSDQAKAMEGPRLITADGPDSWAAAFIAAVKGASPEDMAKWIKANTVYLDRLKQFPDIYATVQAVLPNGNGKPKPPRPGAQKASPEKPAIPDPFSDPAAWLKWLDATLTAFGQDYEAGSAFWATRVEVMTLNDETQQAAMAIWRKFEEGLT